MKKHLFLFTVITLWLFVQSSFSQDLNMLKNAPFIFKGKVTTVRAFRSKDDNSLYASYIIDITAIYKGENELKLGNVEMIMKAPPSWGIAMIEGDSSSESLTLGGDPDAYYEENKWPIGFGGGETCVFFCNKNKVFSSHGKSDNIKIITNSNSYVGKITDVKFDNTVILEPICNTMNCLFYYYNEMKIIDKNRAVEVPKIDGFGKKFDSEDELMEYLKKENIISSSQIIKKKDVEKIINT